MSKNNRQQLKTAAIALLCFFSQVNFAQRDSLRYYFDLSEKYYDANDTLKFIDAATNYIRLDSSDWIMYLNRGVMRNKIQSEKRNAVGDYKKARALNKESYKPLMNLGSTLIDLGEFRLAKRYLDTALSMNSTHAKIYYLIGVTFGRTHQHDSCLKYLLLSERLDPNDAALHKDKGIVYNAQKKYEKAIEEFDKSLELDPKEWRASCGKANSLVRLKKFAEAKESLDNAATLTEDPMVDGLYFFYYMSMDDKSMACYHVRRAISKGMKDAEQFLPDACGGK